MGRTIVRVPAGFEHPQEEGEYVPGAHYELLDGVPESELTHWQVYEDTSEGTPVSPAFADREGLVDWLVANWGMSREGAIGFVDHGRAPSFLLEDGGLHPGTDVFERGSE